MTSCCPILSVIIASDKIGRELHSVLLSLPKKHWIVLEYSTAMKSAGLRHL